MLRIVTNNLKFSFVSNVSIVSSVSVVSNVWYFNKGKKNIKKKSINWFWFCFSFVVKWREFF